MVVSIHSTYHSVFIRITLYDSFSIHLVMSYSTSCIKTSTIRQVFYKFFRDFKIEKCKDIKSTNDFRNCVTEIYNFIKNRIAVFSEVTQYDCALICIEFFEKTIHDLVNFEEKFDYIIRAYTTAGDSIFEKGDKSIPKSIKRLIRHVDVNEDLVVYHILRYVIAKNITIKLTKCLVEKCGIKNVENFVKEFIQDLVKPENENLHYSYTIEKVYKWLRKIKQIEKD